jgi:hypothetical protein
MAKTARKPSTKAGSATRMLSGLMTSNKRPVLNNCDQVNFSCLLRISSKLSKHIA